MAIDKTNKEALSLDLYGDVLESVVTQVPSIDLLQASCVSKEWRHAVRSSLRRHPRLLPWLILRHLPRPNSPSFSIHAFDPFSRTWLSVPPKSSASDKLSDGTTKSFLCGSKGDRLFGLSLSKMVISDDPFGCTWEMETKGAKVWRQDPVVADLGRWIVLAGGGFLMTLGDEEEEGAVEIYDKESNDWHSAESLPVQFDGSTSAMWLSTAVSSKRLYVVERKTGWICWFNPESKKWGRASQLSIDMAVSEWCITIGRKERLILVGARREGGEEIKVKVWELEGESFRVVNNNSDEMPAKMAERLFPSREEDDAMWQACRVEVCGTEHGGYVYNPTQVQNGAVLYEFSSWSSSEETEERRIVKKWEWVPPPERETDNLMGRTTFGCSSVGLGELSALS